MLKFSFKASDLGILIGEIEKLARLETGMSVYASFLTGELERLNDTSSIQGAYDIQNALVDKEEIIVDHVKFRIGYEVAKYFRGAEKVAMVICTAGDEVTARAKLHTDQGDLIEGYLLDVLGSIMVEKAMDRLQSIIKEEMSLINLKITNRYSPGYCDWNVNEQHDLFRFFPNNFCGVTLNSSGLMHPVKSVSGMIGIGEKVIFQKHICHACNSVNCLYRKG